MADNDADNENESKVPNLEDSIDRLSEKRSATREGALEDIIKDLKMSYQAKFLEQRKVTLLEALKRGLKKGTVKEQQLSGAALSLLCITLGADSESIYKEVAPTLEEMIAKPSNSEVQASAIDVLSMTCFVGNSDAAITLKVLELLESVFTNSKNATSIDEALKGWGLLLTTTSRRHIYDTIIPVSMPTIVQLLHHDDVDVRVAAGECIALLFEIARDIEEDSFDATNFGRNTALIDVDDLLDTLYGLAKDKTKSRAKKDKIKQKAPFQEIRNYVESGEEPREILSFKHQKFEFNTWSQIKQLNALRECLGEGLQTHFENNELLLEIFDVALDKNIKKVHLSAIEKRMFMSPNSPVKKQSTKNLNKQRSDKGVVTSEYLTDD